jgi:lipoprotein-anchoring transpeptidase ErfK/SrfK
VGSPNVDDVLTSLRPRPVPILSALLAVLALVASACSSSGSGGATAPSNGVVTGHPGVESSAGSSAPVVSESASAPVSESASKSEKPKKPVHIRLINSDGSTYGVGMPVIAFFSGKIKDAKPLQDATTVTINGHKAQGAWYFEPSSYYEGYPIEAHFRLENFWPAHASIHVDIPTKGLSAGGNLAYDDSLTLDFSTGPRNIATVDDSTHKMTVVSDGKNYGTFPVSLGADDPQTRTFNGTKVIMEQVKTVCMQDVRGTYHECGIKWDQRVTYSGEYLHAAPWNVSNIQKGVDSSNGCTNLLPDDAVKLYHFLRVGDVVEYPNANGPAMTMGAGYGDWNVSWGEWQTGGLVPTT